MTLQHASHLSDIAGTYSADCPDCNGHLKANIFVTRLRRARKALVEDEQLQYVLDIMDGKA